MASFNDLTFISPKYREVGTGDYVEKICRLLAEHEWIYDFQLTRFFVEKVWEKLPEEWGRPLLSLSTDELNSLPSGHVRDDWPTSLKAFVETAASMALPRQQSPDLVAMEINKELARGMTPKKTHEVSYLASVISDACRKTSCDTVIDVGSGLGYLGQVLHQQCGLTVVGVEAQASHVHGAQRRIKSQGENEKEIQTVNLTLQDRPSCINDLEQLITSLHKSPLQGQRQDIVLHQSLQSGETSESEVEKFTSHIGAGESTTDGSETGEGATEHSRTGKSRMNDNGTRKGTPNDNRMEKSTTNETETGKGRKNYSGTRKDTTDDAETRKGTANDNRMEKGTINESDTGINGRKNYSGTRKDTTDDAETVNSTTNDRRGKGTCMEKGATNDSEIREGRTNDSESGKKDTTDDAETTNSTTSADRRGKGTCMEKGTTDESETGKGRTNDSESGKDTTNDDETTNSSISDDKREKVKFGQKTFLVMTTNDTKTGKGRTHDSESGKDTTNDAETRNSSMSDDKREKVKFGQKTFLVMTTNDTKTGKGRTHDSESGKDTTNDAETTNSSTGADRRGKGTCMVGLHCCGDLCPTMLKLFTSVQHLGSLVCVSCCYHRMSSTDPNSRPSCFTNFPLSRTVKKTLRKVSADFPTWQLNVFAMRLAAQETQARWTCQTHEDHQFHTRTVAYRAILEHVMTTGGKGIQKLKRKVTRKDAFQSFPVYLEAVFERLTLHTEEASEASEDWEKYHDALQQSHDQWEEFFPYIEAITALQVLLQPVLETLVTVDRCLYLQEHGLNTEVVPVFDYRISPRNLAIIAER